jgi:hypothetical protein
MGTEGLASDRPAGDRPDSGVSASSPAISSNDHTDSVLNALNIPPLWSCAADKLAEAEKLLGKMIREPPRQPLLWAACT